MMKGVRMGVWGVAFEPPPVIHVQLESEFCFCCSVFLKKKPFLLSLGSNPAMIRLMI